MKDVSTVPNGVDVIAIFKDGARVKAMFIEEIGMWATSNGGAFSDYHVRGWETL